MPKGRYAAMKSSLGSKGRLALDMMLMTATVQANLDWSDEADLASKVRAATSVSPIVTAIFANSPLVNGRESSYLDFRYQVWRETDDARCGLLEQMLQPGWGIGGTSSGPSTSPCSSFATGANTGTPAVRPSAAG